MTIAKHEPGIKAKKTPKSQKLDVAAPEASRMAVVILEVLAGVRSPQDAANTLGITSPRYYQLETRALNGLVAALKPRPKGKQPSLEGRIHQLERTLEAARRETARQQALARVTQRSLGLKPPPPGDSKASGKDKAGRRKRRPTVRALKVARTLADQSPPAEVDVVQQSTASLPSVDMAVCGMDKPSHGMPFIAPGAPR
jgi:hypothetical protein